MASLLVTRRASGRSSPISRGGCPAGVTLDVAAELLYPISNACKFTPAGGKLTISTKLIIPQLPPGPDGSDTSETAGEDGRDSRPQSVASLHVPPPQGADRECSNRHLGLQ